MSNYTGDDYLLADVLLRKFPMSEPRFTHSLFSGMMMGEQNNFDAETFTRLSQWITMGGGSNARKILLEKGFLDCIDISYPTDKLTDKGKIAKEKGGINEYKKWEKKESKKQNKMTFPQRNWLPISILTGLLGFLSNLAVDIISDKLKQKTEPTSTQPNKQIQVLTDTVYIYLPDSSLKHSSKPN